MGLIPSRAASPDSFEDIRYRAALQSNASQEEVLDLMRYTDSVAEIHNTLRRGTPVILEECQVIEARSAQ